MTETRPPTRAGARSEALRDVVRAIVEPLQGRYLANESTAVATLARLRRCDPAEVGVDPLVWEVTLAGIPTSLTDRHATGATSAEQAVHAAVVLYALHQQGHRDEAVHRRGITIGLAAGQLARARARDTDLDRSVVQRFHQVALGNTMAERLWHLRSLIMLMRAETPVVCLDYGLLAADLGRLADPRLDHSAVLTRWGRDLHFKPASTNAEEKP